MLNFCGPAAVHYGDNIAAIELTTAYHSPSLSKKKKLLLIFKKDSFNPLYISRFLLPYETKLVIISWCFSNLNKYESLFISFDGNEAYDNLA